MEKITRLDEAQQKWVDIELRHLLSSSALAVGAGTPTDSGVAWTLPTEVANPIRLAGGIPDPDTLPVKDLTMALEQVLLNTAVEALNYGGVKGFEGLCSSLALRQSKIEKLPLTSANFIVNNGAAGGIDNICDAFLDPGDVVIIEGPSFSGSVRTFKGHMAEVVQAPMDDDGLIVERVRDQILLAKKSGRKVKLLYTISDFHNPTGTNLAMDRRLELIELCSKHNLLIIEDSAYSEIFFNNDYMPSLFSIAQGEGVLKVATFSKIIATGLRTGWVQGRADFIEALTRVRYDMGNSPLIQRALANIIDSGKLDLHVDQMRPIYAKKCETLVNSLISHCPQYLKFIKPDGGFFLWVECIGVNANIVLREAAKLGLIFPGGAIFYLNGEQDNTSHLRLAFSTASLSDLEESGLRLRSAFDRAIGEV